jgi:hypothetical protein
MERLLVKWQGEAPVLLSWAGASFGFSMGLVMSVSFGDARSD